MLGRDSHMPTNYCSVACRSVLCRNSQRQGPALMIAGMMRLCPMDHRRQRLEHPLYRDRNLLAADAPARSGAGLAQPPPRLAPCRRAAVPTPNPAECGLRTLTWSLVRGRSAGSCV